MKKYQKPVMETVMVSNESILTTSESVKVEKDVLFDASQLGERSNFGGN